VMSAATSRKVINKQTLKPFRYSLTRIVCPLPAADNRAREPLSVR
jgi:hypothetical protein